MPKAPRCRGARGRRDRELRACDPDGFSGSVQRAAGRRYLAEQVEAQERDTLAQRQIAELARTRYREGVVIYLEVLDAERKLFAAKQGLLQLRRAELENLVALYVVLGGGVIERR